MVDLQRTVTYLNNLQKEIQKDEGVWSINYNGIDECFEIQLNHEYFIEIADEFNVKFDEVGIDEVEPFNTSDPFKFRVEFYNNDILLFSYLTDEVYEEFRKGSSR